MKELVVALATKTGLSQKDARAYLDAVLDEITARLLADGKIRLADFGTFSVKNRPARTGRNPRTGEKLTIPAVSRATFKPGAGLRDRVSGLTAAPEKQEVPPPPPAPTPDPAPQATP